MYLSQQQKIDHFSIKTRRKKRYKFQKMMLLMLLFHSEFVCTFALAPATLSLILFSFLFFSSFFLFSLSFSFFTLECVCEFRAVCVFVCVNLQKNKIKYKNYESREWELDAFFLVFVTNRTLSRAYTNWKFVRRIEKKNHFYHYFLLKQKKQLEGKFC